MVERDIQKIWGVYLAANPPPETEAHELKLCKGPSFAFEHVQEHQIENLRKITSGLYYKISDMAATNGYASPKPFDCFWIKGGKGYIVIVFFKPRQYKKAFKIPVDEFVKLKYTWARKSIRLTEIEDRYTAINL